MAEPPTAPVAPGPGEGPAGVKQEETTRGLAAPSARLCVGLLVVALTLILTTANFRLVAAPGLREYQWMQERVLRNRASNYYQYDMFFVTAVEQAVRTRFDLPPVVTLTGLFGVSYLAAFLASGYWLRQLYGAAGPVVVGLLATGLYALGMLPFSYHHPSDLAALACFALSLGLIVRHRWGWLLVVCVIAGLFSSKQVLIALPVGAELLRRGLWRRAAFGAAAAGLAALVVPSVYRFWLLGPHAVTASGTLGLADWLGKLPAALVVHFMLAAVPLATLSRFRRRLAPTVLGALAAYVALVAICVGQLNIIHEARTFWVGVPAFAAALALWGCSAAPGASDDVGAA